MDRFGFTKNPMATLAIQNELYLNDEKRSIEEMISAWEARERVRKSRIELLMWEPLDFEGYIEELEAIDTMSNELGAEWRRIQQAQCAYARAMRRIGRFSK
jgi:hypothetical protein